jgi:glyceraldehyde-3-phosphate dehydrogenase/erythrose-4-phosphate dehydrogenase
MSCATSINGRKDVKVIKDKIIHAIEDHDLKSLKDLCTDDGVKYIVESTNSFRNSKDIIKKFKSLKISKANEGDGKIIVPLSARKNPITGSKKGYMVFLKKGDKLLFSNFRGGK